MGRSLDRILFAADDPDVREIARLGLEDIGGFSVEVCQSATQALERINVFNPDIVLLDVEMPSMDNPRTRAALGESTERAKIPIVFLTVQAEKSNVRRYEELGTVDAIGKPLDPMTVSDELMRIWESWQDQRLSPCG